MPRIILMMFLCLLFATGIASWFHNLPHMSTANKKMIKAGLIVLFLAAGLFFLFIVLLQADNINHGVLKQ